MTTKIRIGIIGLGYLGKFHYQKYMLNPSVKVTSIVDTARLILKLSRIIISLNLNHIEIFLIKLMLYLLLHQQLLIIKL